MNIVIADKHELVSGDLARITAEEFSDAQINEVPNETTFSYLKIYRFRPFMKKQL